MLLVKWDVSVWHEARVLTFALLTSCDYSWAMSSYRRATFRSEPAGGVGCIELFCPIFASPVSHLVHLAGFGPQPVSWTALSTGAVTPSPSAVCVTRSGWRTSSGSRWGMAKATAVCEPPWGGHFCRETRVWNPGWAQCQAPAVCQVLWWDADTRTQFFVSPSEQVMFDRGVTPDPPSEHPLRVESILGV